MGIRRCGPAEDAVQPRSTSGAWAACTTSVRPSRHGSGSTGRALNATGSTAATTTTTTVLATTTSRCRTAAKAVSRDGFVPPAPPLDGAGEVGAEGHLARPLLDPPRGVHGQATRHAESPLVRLPRAVPADHRHQDHPASRHRRHDAESQFYVMLKIDIGGGTTPRPGFVN